MPQTGWFSSHVLVKQGLGVCYDWAAPSMSRTVFVRYNWLLPFRGSGQKIVISFSAEAEMFWGEIGQYHGCWWLGSLHRQVISSIDIDWIEWIWSLPSRRKVLTICAILRNDRKYKSDYTLIFLLTHFPLVLHAYMSVNQVSISSDNGLSPIWRQAII